MRANAAAAGGAAQRTVARSLSVVGDSLPEGELATCYRVPSATADARGRGDICGSRRGGVGNVLEMATKILLITGGKSERTLHDFKKRRAISLLQCQRAMST